MIKPLPSGVFLIRRSPTLPKRTLYSETLRSFPSLRASGADQRPDLSVDHISRYLFAGLLAEDLAYGVAFLWESSEYLILSLLYVVANTQFFINFHFSHNASRGEGRQYPGIMQSLVVII
jgi:hypothetical protein